MKLMNLRSLFTRVHLITFSVAVLTFSLGATLTWSSPVLPKLESKDGHDIFDEPITTNQSTWISSYLTLGAAIGSLLYGYLANVLGRRISILSLGPPMILSYILMSSIGNVGVYYFSRFLAGVVIGGGFTMTPIYMSELVSKSERGRLSGFIAASGCLGFIYSYSVGPFIPVRYFNISLIGFPCVFLILFFIYGDETAHYYAMTGNKELAHTALIATRSSQDNVEIELSEIFKKIEEASNEGLLQSLLSKTNMKAFAIAIGLFIFQQTSGVICLQFYNQEIFEMTGSNIKAEYCPIIIGTLQFLSGFCTAFITDKFGRKTLLSCSALGMTIAEIPLGVYCYLKDEGKVSASLNFIPLLCLAAFIITYNAGYGPLPFTVTGEIFPSSCRTVAISVVMFISWVVSFVTTKYFDDIVKIVGLGQCFLIFAGFCLLSIIFVNTVVIETKGKTLEEIQDRLSEPVTLRKRCCAFA